MIEQIPINPKKTPNNHNFSMSLNIEWVSGETHPFGLIWGVSDYNHSYLHLDKKGRILALKYSYIIILI